jgi:hypothetical protein
MKALKGKLVIDRWFIRAASGDYVYAFEVDYAAKAWLDLDLVGDGSKPIVKPLGKLPVETLPDFSVFLIDDVAYSVSRDRHGYILLGVSLGRVDRAKRCFVDLPFQRVREYSIEYSEDHRFETAMQAKKEVFVNEPKEPLV